MTIGPIRRTGRPLRIGIALDEVRRFGRAWRVRWLVRNGSDRAMTVHQAWHPHGRFRSSRLSRAVRIPPRGSATIEVPARTDARPGEVVENCFLILRVASGRERFRVLARSTLVVDPDGTPRPRVEAVDVHPAGR
ncbi:MAG: hypothetical protein HYU87_03645 [Chloroflexi bacterium]|nr:hypothetical protein [Chloroflexota bacterium]